MSASFLWAACPQPKLDDDRKEALRRFIANISEDDISYIADDGPVRFTEQRHQDIREEILDHIEEACTCDSVAVSEIQLPGMACKVAITGGMSHGDSPTGIFDCFCLIGFIDMLHETDGLYDLLAKWRMLDEFDEAADLNYKTR